MQTANKELEQKEKADKNYKGPSAEMRTRTFQHGALTKMFVDAMSVYQQVQEANKAKFRARTEREIKIGALPPAAGRGRAGLVADAACPNGPWPATFGSGPERNAGAD